VNPRTLLTASGISPAAVAALLPAVELDDVAVRPAPRWLARIWGSDISAMTLRTTIYVRSSLLDSDPATLGPLIVHELVHVQQWAQLGIARFLWRYMTGYLRGRLTGLSHPDAYRAIPLEIEAREIAAGLGGSISPI
jgi:hypothetical protein